tara:strand:- start:2273 stop:2554 length:282 start_codon:yes stop_codon:yes gene_type:complete
MTKQIIPNFYHEILDILYYVEHDLSIELNPELTTELVCSDELNAYFNFNMKEEDLTLIFETEIGEGKITLKNFATDDEEFIYNQVLMNLKEPI